MIGIGVVGCGRWGQNLIRTFAGLSGAKLLACCGHRDEQKLAMVRARHPDVATTQDFNELLSNAEIDAVVIASPDETHFELASRALDAGKHVFVEKPIALDLTEAETLLQKAERGRKVLMTGYVMLYHPAVRWIKRQVDAGIMRPTAVMSTRVDFGIARDADLMWSSAIHDVAIIQHLLDQEPEEMQAVYASIGRPGVADMAFANFVFRDGAIGHIRVSFAGPSRERRLVLHAREAIVSFDGTTNAVELYKRNEESRGGEVPSRGYDKLFIREDAVPIEGAEPLQLECQDFVESIASERIPVAGGRRALGVIRTLDRLKRQANQTRNAV